ncbi:Mannosyl-oligosaccharide alpha-1,3-glucosidase [Penicillium ucsense]|uniref:Crh-like protein n=1 Tax=Penicillium ucsense TaxID=2839758 RepID=A0A8J8WEU0_9EURO|nr:Mannosyl-oligosaccharide alpha-1,3-glucosidase [Penicillium ucsense]KAF7730775.1 Mannosyl-oligosaccharide alpha-1,3-glucosidase [Penicillium ucsense]
MPSFFKYAAMALAVTAPFASAQTYTDCDPLKKTCPADAGSTESKMSFDFTKPSGLNKWKTTAGKVNAGPNGAAFTVAQQGDAPTIETDFYIFYGEVSVTMQAAPGQGIVSSIVFESDDLDEIDWEALGGNTAQIETNYFGKGDTSTYNRDTWPAVANPQTTFHTYTVNWQKDKTVWSIDGTPVRTLQYSDASGGSRYPQTPMRVRIGVWAGGDPRNGKGTIEWAGGATDYSKAPFSMYVKSVSITNTNPATSYTYTDNTGSSGSIKMNGAGTLNETSVSSGIVSATTSATDSKSTATGTHTTMATTVHTTATSSETISTGSSSIDASSSTSKSGSPSSASSSAQPTASYNAAPSVVASYLGPVSLLGLLTALLQL